MVALGAHPADGVACIHWSTIHKFSDQPDVGIQPNNQSFKSTPFVGSPHPGEHKTHDFQMMGVDPLEKEWEDLKSTSRDKEYVKRIKEVIFTLGCNRGRADGSCANNCIRRGMLSKSWDWISGIGERTSRLHCPLILRTELGCIGHSSYLCQISVVICRISPRNTSRQTRTIILPTQQTSSSYYVICSYNAVEAQK